MRQSGRWASTHTTPTSPQAPPPATRGGRSQCSHLGGGHPGSDSSAPGPRPHTQGPEEPGVNDPQTHALKPGSCSVCRGAASPVSVGSVWGRRQHRLGASCVPGNSSGPHQGPPRNHSGRCPILSVVPRRKTKAGKRQGHQLARSRAKTVTHLHSSPIQSPSLLTKILVCELAILLILCSLPDLRRTRMSKIRLLGQRRTSNGAPARSQAHILGEGE